MERRIKENKYYSFTEMFFMSVECEKKREILKEMIKRTLKVDSW